MIKFINDTSLSDIANAVRNKFGVTHKMTVNEMIDVIEDSTGDEHYIYPNSMMMYVPFQETSGEFNFVYNLADAYRDNANIFRVNNGGTVKTHANDISPVCGDNVVDLYRAFMNVTELKGSPVCGENVTNMYGTYYRCNKLTGAANVGSKVTNMAMAYYMTTQLYTAACGPNVINMASAYGNSGVRSCACGINVVNMYSAYEDCVNLNGIAEIGPNVINASRAYINCKYIDGISMGQKVQDISYTFYRCFIDLHTSEVSPNVTNMAYSYYGDSIAHGKSGINVINAAYAYHVNNQISSTNKMYMKTVACGPNVVNLAYYTQDACNIDKAHIGRNVTDARYAYSNANNVVIYCDWNKAIVDEMWNHADPNITYNNAFSNYNVRIFTRPGIVSSSSLALEYAKHLYSSYSVNSSGSIGTPTISQLNDNSSRRIGWVVNFNDVNSKVYFWDNFAVCNFNWYAEMSENVAGGYPNV